jgi:hypothetical protein
LEQHHKKHNFETGSITQVNAGFLGQGTQEVDFSPWQPAQTTYFIGGF